MSKRTVMVFDAEITLYNGDTLFYRYDDEGQIVEIRCGERLIPFHVESASPDQPEHGP